MTFTAQLLSVTDAFLAAPASAGLTESTLSWRAFGETKVLRRLASGEQSITLIRADRALCWLSANWPADAAWPDGVERPDPESDCGERTPENRLPGFTTAEGPSC
jgi:hypothetical protein